MRHAISRLAIALALSAWLPAVALAQQGPIVALFDMEDRGAGLSKQVLDNLTEYLALRLAERGFQIIPREQVRERLSEQKKDSFRSCYEQSCQIELGRELAAQKALATRVLKIADTCQVGATLYDLKRATTEKAASAEANCTEKSLLEAIKAIAVKLTGQSEPVATAPATPPQPAPPAEELKTPPAAETPSPEAPASAPPAEAAPAAESAAAAPAAPSLSPFEARRFNLGLQGGGLSPTRGETWAMKLSKDGYPGEDSLVNMNPGFFADLYFDWRLSLPISLGLVASFFAADTKAVRLRDRDNKIGFLSLSARVKYRWRVHRTVEIRPGAAAGLGVVTGGSSYIEELPNHWVELKGFVGLSLALNAECAWYLSDSFGLVIDLGVVASPVAKGNIKVDTDTYKATLSFPPFIYLAVGGELGF